MRYPIKIFLCDLLFFILPQLAQGQTQETQSQRSPAKNFEGFALQIDVGYQPYVINGNSITIKNTSIKLPDQKYNSNSTPYFSGLSYTIPANERITVGAQIEINPINQQYVLSFLPGYAFTPSLQGYLKFAWVNALVTINANNAQNNISLRSNGTTTGLGIKQLLTQNWYGFAEANYVKMNTFKFESSNKGIPINGSVDYSGFNIMVGIGYLF